jgi:hypothetical protein
MGLRHVASLRPSRFSSPDRLPGPRPGQLLYGRPFPGLILFLTRPWPSARLLLLFPLPHLLPLLLFPFSPQGLSLPLTARFFALVAYIPATRFLQLGPTADDLPLQAPRRIFSLRCSTWAPSGSRAEKRAVQAHADEKNACAFESLPTSFFVRMSWSNHLSSLAIRRA